MNNKYQKYVVACCLLIPASIMFGSATKHTIPYSSLIGWGFAVLFIGLGSIMFGLAAFYSKAMPWPQFNTVKGLGSGEIHIIDDIIEYYKNRNRKFQIEITPQKANREMSKILDEKGVYQSDFHASLFSQPRKDYDHNEAIVIRPLKEHEFDMYAEIHCLGTGLSIEGKNFVSENNKVLYNREGWKFFIGFVNDKPAGAGVMYMSNGIASLTFATTLNEFRNKGIQTALIERRIGEAMKNQ